MLLVNMDHCIRIDARKNYVVISCRGNPHRLSVRIPNRHSSEISGQVVPFVELFAVIKETILSDGLTDLFHHMNEESKVMDGGQTTRGNLAGFEQVTDVGA